ncbi:MAG: 30S ribosomal protein S2 [Candidatus Falkowbacteria bacterium]
MTKLPTIEQMLKAGMHFGHRTSKWHPKMEPFIFGAHGGVHVIDLVKSRKMLETALEFMKKFAAEGKMILFVGTKMQVKKPLKDMAEEVDMPYISEKWMGGCLTNFLIIKKLIKKYKDLLDDKSTGKLDKYTKKERLEFDREIKRLELRVGGLTKLSRLPDAIFVWDIKHEKTAVTEARKKNIPLIAICDTNVNPTGINYVIPSNDDATKTIKLVLGLIKDTINEGKAAANKK